MNKLVVLLLAAIFLLSSFCGNNIINPIPSPIGQAPLLYVEMDNANALTNKLSYQVAGNSTEILAAITLHGDSITQIDSLTVLVNTASPARTFAAIQLVDNDQVTIIADNRNVQTATILKNIGQVSSTAKTLYLKASLNLIGKDEVGLIDAEATFQIGKIWARGVNGGKSVNVIYQNNPLLTQTYPSTKFGVVAARISSVAFVDRYQTLVVASAITDTGWCNVAVIRVTTDMSRNTTNSGDTAKMIQDKIRLNFQKSSGTMIDAVQIGRFNPSEEYFISAPYADNTELDMTQSSIGADEEIAPGTDAYFLARVHITVLDSGQDWIQTNLNNLDGDSATANFVWRDGSDAAQKFPLKLSASILTGTKIIEQ
ncbi:MAG TPA: hypothetical protein VMD74_02080 [Candidatus Methylomirabilis sp.]|nr:hypothetical protein [Candidatus Methylomirabilis sp.]